MITQNELSKYDIQGTIGKGSYGQVFKVIRKQDRKQCVLKKINIIGLDARAKKLAVNEAKLMKEINSPYIVAFYDHFIVKDLLYIVMEYCEGGDLALLLKNQRDRRLKEETVWKFFIQMCIAVRDLHAKRILHRDIKTLNVFLTKEGDVRLGDLGVAKQITTNFAHTLVGTPYYLSPEMCEERPYNEKTDVWALGCVLYEMCTGRHPFEANNYPSLAIKIISGRYEPIKGYSEEMIQLVKQMLAVDYKRRPTVQMIISKPNVQKKIQELNIKQKTEEGVENTLLSKSILITGAAHPKMSQPRRSEPAVLPEPPKQIPKAALNLKPEPKKEFKKYELNPPLKKQQPKPKSNNNQIQGVVPKAVVPTTKPVTPRQSVAPKQFQNQQKPFTKVAVDRPRSGSSKQISTSKQKQGKPKQELSAKKIDQTVKGNKWVLPKPKVLDPPKWLREKELKLDLQTPNAHEDADKIVRDLPDSDDDEKKDKQNKNIAIIAKNVQKNVDDDELNMLLGIQKPAPQFKLQSPGLPTFTMTTTNDSEPVSQDLDLDMGDGEEQERVEECVPEPCESSDEDVQQQENNIYLMAEQNPLPKNISSEKQFLEKKLEENRKRKVELNNLIKSKEELLLAIISKAQYQSLREAAKCADDSRITKLLETVNAFKNPSNLSCLIKILQYSMQKDKCDEAIVQIESKLNIKS